MKPVFGADLTILLLRITIAAKNRLINQLLQQSMQPKRVSY